VTAPQAKVLAAPQAKVLAAPQAAASPPVAAQARAVKLVQLVARSN
jgi:hypothetical protein